MTEKTYTIDVEEHTQENAIFCEDKYVCLEDDYDGVLAELNDLANEKSNLKCRLNRRTRQRDELAEFNVELMEENKKLKEQLKDCQQKKQNIKDVLLNSEPVLEQKKLQKLIYRTVINLIDKKIKEAREHYSNPLYDRRYYQGQYEAFNELKKELKG